MRWTVEGADKQTGRDRVLTIDADSSVEAEQVASEQGLLVAGVYEPTNLDPAEQLEKMVGNSLSNSDLASPPIPPSPPVIPAHPIGYASTSTFTRRPPDYFGLQVGGTVMLIFPYLYYVGAALLLVGALISAIGLVSRQTAGPAALGAVAFSIWGLGAAMVGGLLHAISSGCEALRDIARNSFR